MRVDHVNIETLTSFRENPRTISREARQSLLVSIRQFGLFKPLLVWENADGETVVIGGNQRLGVLRDMAKDESNFGLIPIVYFDGDEAQAKVVALRDNHADGEWDWNALSKYVDDLENMVDSEGVDLDMSLTGLDDKTLSDLRVLASPDKPNVRAEIEGDPEVGPVADGRAVPKDHDDPIEEPEQKYVNGRYAQFTVGNLRGKLPLDLYGRWLQVFEKYTDGLGSTDIGVVVDAMLNDVMGVKPKSDGGDE